MIQLPLGSFGMPTLRIQSICQKKTQAVHAEKMRPTATTLAGSPPMPACQPWTWPVLKVSPLPPARIMWHGQAALSNDLCKTCRLSAR